MYKEEIYWIKDCVEQPLVYHYQKDSYAKQLLRYQFEDGCKISEIKESRFSHLLHRPAVKAALAKCGNARFKKEAFDNSWDEHTEILSTTIADWGIENVGKKESTYFQVSRPQRSLVLQVNFGNDHNNMFYRLFHKKWRPFFQNYRHAGHDTKNSLGWIRLDIDMDNNEVLIEELQTDWIKAVYELKNDLSLDWPYYQFTDENRNACQLYVDHMLRRFKNWDEMLLSTAIRFIKEELAISKVWLHSFESGRYYKVMPDYSLPPKSLYTKLPKKFGFESVNECPKLIKECKELKRMVKHGSHLHFFKLEL